ncbi:MAG: ABC transporter permease subunit [Bacteroidetes bacterium]|nr:MAG: ABC transporter permease subunit [Bacteroidota bacterium]
MRTIKAAARIVGSQALLGCCILLIITLASLSVKDNERLLSPYFWDKYCSSSILGTSVKDTVVLRSTETEEEGAFSSVLSPVAVQEAAKTQCSRNYILGSTSTGKDIFLKLLDSATLYGFPLLLVALLCSLLGIMFGVLNGYYRERIIGKLGSLSSNTISAYPQLLIAILIFTIVGSPGLWVIAIVFGVTESVRLGQAIMNKIAALKKTDFIEAAREIGLSDSRIILKHILWYNCRELIIIHVLFALSGFFLLEAYMGYLGRENFDGWGKLLGDVKDAYSTEPSLLLLSTGFLVLVVSALYLIGEGVIRYLNIDEEYNR